MKRILSAAAVFLLFSFGSLAQQTTRQAEPEGDPRIQLALSSSEYTVTAGDAYQLVYFANGTRVVYPVIVDSSYQIKIANLGTLNAEGKTFLQLKKDVESIILRNYPMGAPQLVFVTPSEFTVRVIGEVTSAQSKKCWALSRLSEVLAGSTTEFSSKRNVSVVSKNGEERTFDVFMALRNGNLAQNPHLRPEDTVVLHKIQRRVSIGGAVQRPGTYELLPGENLRDAIDVFAGGFTPQADKERVELSRMSSSAENAKEKRYLSAQDFEADIALEDLDSIFVHNRTERTGWIFIEGAIIVEQKSTALTASDKTAIQFEADEDYAYLFRRHRGLFTDSSDIKAAYIVRDGTTIPIDISRALYNASYRAELCPQNGDTVIVPFAQNFIIVSGAVNAPGRYPYIPDRDWEYYIALAGGFDKTRNTGKLIHIKDRNGNSVSKKAAVLPEMTITAETNAFTYYFGVYAPILTTTLSLFTAGLTLYIATK